MAWLSRNNFGPSDRLHSDDLNNLANDQRTWGGNVNGGGYVLSNVIIASSVLRASGGLVSSVFGRTGDILAQSGDYTAAMVGAPPTTRQIVAGAGMYGGGPLSADVTLNANVTSVFGRIGAVVLTSADITGATGVLISRNILTPAGSGLTGGGNLSADRSLSVVPDSSNQQVQVLSGGTSIGVRHALNFVNGANVTVTVGDDVPNNRVNVTVAYTGSAGGMNDPTSALGDLIVRGPSVTNRLPVGTNGQVLTADSTQTLGVKWAVPSSASAVTSVFSRTGVVTAQTGDYTVSQVTNAVDATGSYTNPAWITNIAWAKITNAPAFMIDPLTTKGDVPIHTTTATTRLPVGADGTVLTADSSQGMGVRWGAPPTTPQTPWTTDIDAANHILRNTKAVGAGNVTPAANNPLSVLIASSDVGSTVPSALFSDGASQVQVGCSIHYGATAAPWIQAYLSSGTACPLILQPAGTAGVGIGQLKPAYPLDVAGDINVMGGTYRINGVAISTGGQNQTPWTTDIDAANHNLNNAAGVGIGALVGGTPMLRIQTPNPSVVMQGSTTADIVSIQMLAGSAFKWELGVGHPNAGQFYIRDLNTSAMRLQIDSNGNIGIGHPGGYPLDVAGDINCSGGVFRVNGVALGGVTSIFGRTGVVVAATADYNAAQITNAVDVTQSYSNPTWLASLAWSKIIGAPATGVSTVFGRAGAITAQVGDYSVAQITNAVANTRQILTPAGSGLAGGGTLATDRTLTVIPDSTNQQVQVLLGGISIATRHAINFVNGANVTISVSDDQPNNRVDVSVATGGGGTGGGMTDPTITLGDLIVRGSTVPNRLPIGTPGQVLTVDNVQPLGMKWAAPTGGGGGSQTPWTSDIDAGGHSLNNAGQVNTNVLLAKQNVQIADPSTAVAWNFEFANSGGTLTVVRSSDASPLLLLDGANLLAEVPVPLAVNGTGAPAFPLDVTGDCNVTGVFRQNGVPLDFSGLVHSVFTRTGNVVAQAGDYTAAEVTNAVSTAASYNDPAWITSLAWPKISGAPAFLVDPTTQRGDLIAHGTTTTRLAVGTDGQVLTADSTQAQGLKWATPVGAVTSVFGRTGAVVAVSGDYTAALVTNAVDATGAYANPAWITSLGWSKLTGVPLTTKGDLLVYGTSSTRLPAGTDGQVLTADSTQTLGLKWAAPTASGGQTPWTSNIDAASFNLNNVGAVGIGVGSFASNAPLEVASTNGAGSNATIALIDWTGTIGPLITLGSNFKIGKSGSAGPTAASTCYISSNDSLSIFVDVVGGAPSIRVDGTNGTGNVGIRLSTLPVYPLDVAGDVNCTGVLRQGGTPIASSVFGRTGAVVAANGDYTASQVTNAVSTASSYADPAWLTALSWAKITGAPAVFVDPTSSKGDIIARGSTAPATRLAVGTNNWVLTADSTQTQGVKWAAAPVVSVFGRSGAVVAQSGDYTAAQVGAVPTTTQVIAGSGLSGGGALSANVTLTSVALGASGASHAAGIAPDPGSTSGTSRFLREDATWVAPRTIFRVGHTFAVMGDLTSVTTLPSMFVPLTSNQVANIVGLRTKLTSGTSVGVQLRRNGANVGSVITVTPTTATTAFSQALADGDEITLLLSSPTGTPTTLSATVIMETTP